MKLGVTELVSKVGDENITMQALDHCATNLQYSAKKGTAITFRTNQPITPDLETKDLGVVLWLPRDIVKKILAERAK